MSYKKILALLLALMMMLSVTACKKAPAEKTQETLPVQSTADEVTPDETTSPLATTVPPETTVPATTAPTGVESVSYTIERKSHNLYSSSTDEMTHEQYYDLVTLLGDTEAETAINSFLWSHYQGIKNAFYDECNAKRCGWEDHYPYQVTFGGTVTNNSRGVFSIKHHMDWYAGGVHNADDAGLVFDLNTGETLSLKELTGLSLTGVRDLVWRNIQYYQGGLYSDAYSKLSGFDWKDYGYYVEDNQVVITFGEYQLTYGAGLPPTVYTGIFIE
ncbi:MAG: hypothetical protein IJV88_02450 [Ruminococcus sp.]|nr:hypothetical protein [Ruminococcus sp.]